MLTKIKTITQSISMNVFGNSFQMRVEHDNEFENGRVFLQVVYQAPCTKTGETKEWHGRKWYLSKHMTDDEIVKTCYAAFKATVEHEVMEGFKIGGVVLFNPHVDYQALLDCSANEVSRGKTEKAEVTDNNFLELDHPVKGKIKVPARQYIMNEHQQFAVIAVDFSEGIELDGHVGFVYDCLGKLENQQIIFNSQIVNSLMNDEWDFEKYPNPEIVIINQL